MTDTALVPARARSARPPRRGDASPTPIEKAAMILTAIGAEQAEIFLRGLPSDDLERFARAIAGLGRIDQEVLDAVIAEFLDLLTHGPEISGGTEAARKLLASILDEEEVERILAGPRHDDARSVWERLNETPVAAIAGFLRTEHPQTATVFLSEIRPEVAASVLERLDRDFAQAVVLRLSRVPSLDPMIAQRVEEAVERDFLSVLQRNLSKRRPADLIAGLMNNISAEVRESFLVHLEAQDAVLAQDVQRTMFTFEDIAIRVHGRDIATVMRDVPEETLLHALKLGQGKGSPTVAFILENLPRRLSERYVEELTVLPEITRKEGEAAQIEVTKVVQLLAKAGQIRLIEKDGGG